MSIRKKKFITQQESTAPQDRQPKPLENPVKLPKKRGRPKGKVDLKRLLFMSRIKRLKDSGKRFTREEFAAALGFKPYCVNTMTTAFGYSDPQDNVDNRERQEKIDRNFCKRELISCIPILTSEQILNREFPPVRKDVMETFPIIREPKYGKYLHYFGFIMPDNCMLMDGVCKGDRIVAVRNINPCDGDLVACRMPNTRTVTVRRYAETCNPFLFDLYEGGTLNPFWSLETEGLIQGVVVNVVRDYWPKKMPRKWEPVREVPTYVSDTPESVMERKKRYEAEMAAYEASFDDDDTEKDDNFPFGIWRRQKDNEKGKLPEAEK
ncbi:MAG: hypothetical protein E7053_03935 [Lentisphaerae bacterium]|nr:hypothetical protein [Lentisphaerota bacterium]